MKLKLNLFVVLTFFITAQVSAKSFLVETDWLAKHLNDPNIVLVDMSSDQTQYQRFHIPGAIYLGYANLVEKRKRDKISVRVSDQYLYKLLGFVGISRDSHVVIYDDLGGLNAGRLFWQLERIGHTKVSVVDGGLVKWILEGRKVENRMNKRRPVTYQAGKLALVNEVDFQQISKAASSGDSVLLDVRSQEEYVGHPKFKRTGHIPGAHLWPWDNTVDFDNGFKYKATAALQNSLDKLGVKKKTDKLMLYCRTGHRAAQAYMTLKYLGYQNVKIYDGSMAEYSRIKTAPVRQGKQP